MNRLVFVMLCAGLCLVPILLFAAMNGGSSTPDGYGGYRRGYYRSGPSFLFMSYGRGYGYSSGGYSRGRGYSSGGYRGGGSRSGK